MSHDNLNYLIQNWISYKTNTIISQYNNFLSHSCSSGKEEKWMGVPEENHFILSPSWDAFHIQRDKDGQLTPLAHHYHDTFVILHKGWGNIRAEIG